ncbi:hypothetical protein D3C73_769260 [compost metagenome]
MQGRLRHSRIAIGGFAPVSRLCILRRAQHVARDGVASVVTALGIAGGVEMRGILHRQPRKVVDMAHREVQQKLADNGFGAPQGSEYKTHFTGQDLDVLNRFVPGQAQHQGVQFAFPGGLNTA